MLRTDQPNTGHSPVIEVLKTASFELRELHARYAQVTERIRTLRNAVDALRELRPRSSSEIYEATAGKCSPESNSSNSGPKKWDSVSLRTGDPFLRRACRIALLEAFDAMSVDEIHSRIVRRGSFCFASPSLAKHAIVAELNAMEQCGEVRHITSTWEMKWQRCAPGEG
jgi:hypothetical protein